MAKDPSRRSFLKKLGVAAVAVPVVATTGLAVAEARRTPDIPPPNRLSALDPRYSDNYYEIYPELGEALSKYYGVEAGIWKHRNSPYALMIWLNAHTQYIGPAYNHGYLDAETQHYLTAKFRHLAIRIMSTVELEVTSSGGFLFRDMAHHLVRDGHILCGAPLEKKIKKVTELPKEMCYRCLTLAEDNGIWREDIQRRL